ncbi:MAG: type III-B CRISPR module-associated protein Cmr5 [Thermomicrobium sp.]|jgi:CRISPR-associated protein Cmr5|uniref:type III-B CRISPR module-associated protein Cmr5 n=1 Tax=Thermomicrobium sp. TaxID=1969469 RepID=UPI001B1D15AF|nr:type III-B CRISPR module-associated protein Cmr5 [Thermomicrobium sp.]MBO9360401.1 type III-B CRISPR module-associated protein Cmr5 [Thermomicrobium sp.]MBO9405358.1 type III-B CRISPR module-associated protein Cmr5 [Thermomicrobium sp.]
MSIPQSRQRILEQQRAAFAWQCVQAVQRTDFASEYGQLAREAASLVQMHGLGQTLAFLASKAKDQQNEHRQLARDLSRWVSQQLLGTPRDDLREWIVRQASVAEYRRATLEALAFLAWLKRFAEAELVKEGADA